MIFWLKPFCLLVDYPPAKAGGNLGDSDEFIIPR